MDELRNPICFLRGLWWNLLYWRKTFWEGVWLSGHDFDASAEVMKCRTCGFETAGYEQ